MKVVIDTNVMLSAFSRKSNLNWIFRSLVNAKLELCVTTEILLEYAEIFEERTNANISEMAIRDILNFPILHKVDLYFKWLLIKADPDDNKFVDCAIASSADYIVTNDHHFDILKTIPFPSVKVINVNEFKEIFEKLYPLNL